MRPGADRLLGDHRVGAAFQQDVDVPGEEEHFIAANAEFFGPHVTGWGMPGGVSPKYVTKLDVPLVRDYPAQEPPPKPSP